MAALVELGKAAEVKPCTPSERQRWVNRADLTLLPDSAKDNARRVLSVLADYADRHVFITCVGMETIASQLSLSSKTINRCLPKLERARLIVMKRIRRRGNMYMLLMGDLDKSTLEKLVDIFKDGKNFDQIKESLTDTMVSLRGGEKDSSLTDTLTPSNGQHSVLLTGESKDNRGKTLEKKKKNVRHKATPPPVTIEVTEPMEVWATDQGISVDLETETESMLDHYRSKGDTRVDWMAVWRNWMRRAETFSQQRKGNGYKSQADKMADNLAAAWERAENNTTADQTGGEVPRLWLVSDDKQ